jgi:hypothetical protein
LADGIDDPDTSGWDVGTAALIENASHWPSADQAWR